MSPARVVDRLEISLNGKYYRLMEPVRPFLASEFPQKLVTGDYTKDSSDIVSTQSWSDARGGVGVEVMDITKDADRSWMSDLDTRFRGHLLLPPLATDTALTSSTPYRLNSMGGFIYLATSNNVKRYNGSWSANLNTLDAAPRDTLVVNLGGTNWFIIATGTSIYYTTNGTTWYNDTQQTPSYLAFWDGQLWAIQSNGITKTTDTLSTTPSNNVWQTRDRLPIAGTWVQGLFSGPDADNKQALYGLTQRGLWIYDDDTARWVPTGLQFPAVAVDFLQLRIAYAVWQELIYIGGAGLSVYEYHPRDARFINVGLRTADGGIPSAYRGRISELVPTFDDLVAVVNGQPYGGKTTVMAWDTRAWRLLYSGAVNGKAYIGHASSEVSTNRIYWGDFDTATVYYIDLPIDRVNPKQVTGYTYQSGSLIHYDPWFDGGWENIDKLALRVVVGTLGITATETVEVAYALNGSSSFTVLGTINIDGTERTTYKLPNSTAPNGVVFRRIQFRRTLVRGGTNTTSPDSTFVSLEYMKRPVVIYGWDVVLDMRKAGKAGTPLEQEAAIRTVMESGTLVEFTFRDDATNTRNYYVVVKTPHGQEQTGNREEGQMALQLIGLHQTETATPQLSVGGLFDAGSL